MDTVAISFLLFLFSFIGVGALSAIKRKQSMEDYLLASRSVNPWLTALSAVSTNNSGYMFVGLIGYVYSVGLSAIWIMVGWISGDYLAWRWFHQRVREESQRSGALTFPSFLCSGISKRRSWISRIGAVVLLSLLGLYAAAQLKAGSKALYVLFGWDYSTGAVIGAGIVLIYCIAGGIRASIWTDAAQSLIMLGSMSLLLVVAVAEGGGAQSMWNQLAAIDPKLIHPVPQNLKLGFAVYLTGWLAAGLGVVGQPHIMVRMMAIDSSDNVQKARKIYITWYILFTIAAIGVGLASRVLLSDPSHFDAELALPKLSLELLPPALVGLVLAGLFSATMSTADSQILSCSAALTHDIFPERKPSLLMAKAGTFLVTLMVLFLALGASESVFGLVVIAWSALASAFGPLLILQSLKRPVDFPSALGTMLGGLAVMLWWRFGINMSASLYEVFPGMAAGFICYYLLRPKGVLENDRYTTYADLKICSSEIINEE